MAAGSPVCPHGGGWAADALADVGPVFVDTDTWPGGVAESSRTHNEGECRLVLELLRAWPAERPLVLAPYVLQTERLEAAVREAQASAEVLTIDKAQGRDTRCVIVSLVRSNPQGEAAELLVDDRRLNVAITRAKHKLVLVGSGSTSFGCGRAESLQQVLKRCRYVRRS